MSAYDDYLNGGGETPYGVSANGKPTYTGGTAVSGQCPSGQKWDASTGQCVSTTLTAGQSTEPQHQQASNPSPYVGFTPIINPTSNPPLPPASPAAANPNGDSPYWTTLPNGTVVSGNAQGATLQPQSSVPAKPTGGNIQDPAYARQLVAYFGSQPGADPSLTSNPDYWVQKMTSGEFGSDQSYAEDKMLNAWKTPANNMQSFLGGFDPGPAPATFAPTAAPTLDFTSYKSPLADYTADPTEKTTSDLLMKLLTSGGSMGPSVVAQLKEAQKGGILDQIKQANQSVISDAASRGVSGSGQPAALLNGNELAGISNISRAYNTIDTNAAQTNFNDQLGAVGQSNAFNNQLLQQFLGTQGLKDNEAQFGYNAEQQKQLNILNSYLASQGFMSQQQQIDFNQWLAQMTNGQSNQLAVAKFLAGA